jgi:3-isopropylmalate/(R)-2-methylmalate dehydratase large subunit
MGMTMAEKILAKKAGLASVVPGQIVTVEPDFAMSHDNAGLVIKQFNQFGLPKVWAKDKIVIPLDHRTPAESVESANIHKEIREFVKAQDITHFYDIIEGICHQVMVEKGHARPGELVVGTDSHTTTYGAVGCLSTGIGATEMAAIWATGKIWLRVPETLKITVTGSLPKGVYAKDLILHIIGKLTVEGANYKSVEFYGDTIERMSVSERMTLANLSMEMGAKCALVPFDKTSEEYFRANGLAFDKSKAVYSDADAKYEQTLDVDASKLEPQVACPHNVDNVKNISEMPETIVNQALLGSCTNGRLDDIAIAAGILKGKKVCRDVRLLVFPASRTVLLQAIEKGYITDLVTAGAVVMNPGCGPCLGAHAGLLADGEKVISSSNRNFKGRMGSATAGVYLGSPAMVAASAITGKITDPREFV